MDDPQAIIAKFESPEVIEAHFAAADPIQAVFGGEQGVPGPTGQIGPAGPTGPAGPSGPAGTTSWNGLVDKPSTFPPSVHNHDELYFAIDGGLGQLNDVYESSVQVGDVLVFNGSVWANTQLPYVPNSLIGASNGVCPLNSSGQVPAANLPSYVDDVLEYSAQASFPEAGETGKIYVDQTTNKTYRWSGTAYIELTDATAIWGQISGAIANQADLQSALNAKEPTIAPGTTAQYRRGDNTWQVLNSTAVSEGANLYFTAARAIAAALSGYVSGAGTISASDTVLQAIQKLNGNDALREPAITAGTTAQYLRGDKSLGTLNQAAVAGLTTSDVVGFAGATFGTATHLTGTYAVKINQSTAGGRGLGLEVVDSGTGIYVNMSGASRSGLNNIVFLADAGTNVSFNFAGRNSGGTTTFSVTPAGAITASSYVSPVFSGVVKFPQYTFGTVPSASANAGMTIAISDRSQRLATSDGTNWNWAGTTTAIS